MTILTLLPQSEKLAPENSFNLDPPLLYHQVRTYESLHTHDLVMNTYNTGTGKTLASLLHLFDLQGKHKNVLFIAPTNALLDQHAEDIEEFVARYSLDFKVQRVSAAEVRALNSDLRSGEIVQRLIRNYLEFASEEVARKPLILVVNPDIFYYALFFQYGAHDRRNVFEQFLTRFDYVIIDEFHYYDSKQLANFLFALALFDEFGYFVTRGRKVCLLSATPLPHVPVYLDRLFGDRWTLVSPENEPPESADYPLTPTLAPLTLTIKGGAINDWVSGSPQVLAGWIRDQLDGALISNSLWRINQAYETLKPFVTEKLMGRITGPEPAEKRIAATARALILATPTVDIGYNFKKKDKPRQNVDFLVCDARFGDEFVQRLGRAGRVLGKPQVNQPAQAIALLPPEAAEALAGLDGQILSRGAFAQRIQECTQLPPKHNLTGYIRSWAITESFYPIFEMGKMMGIELHEHLERLYDRARELFVPSGRRTYKGLNVFFSKYHKRHRWLEETGNGQIPLDKFTAEHVADWLEAWHNAGRYDPSDLLPGLGQLLEHQEQRDDLRAFAQSQVAITRTLFSFRDSFQGPTAVVYDPDHLLSSETFNAYDLFHLISHYNLSPPMTKKQFEREFGTTTLQGGFYFRLRGWREPKLSLEFTHHSRHEREAFENRWCRKVVGMAGLHLQAREAGGDVLTGGLLPEITCVLEDQHLACLIILSEDTGAAVSRLRGTPIWSRRLTVRFDDGAVEDGYRIFTGKAAFEAHAELLGHFLMKDRLKPDSIIV